MHVSKETDYVDSLRLSEHDQTVILGRLAEADSGSKNNKRLDSRVNYQLPSGLVVRMHHPGGSVVNFLVRARNLSRGGIAFLHGSFVYNGTRCELALRAINNTVVTASGQVVRCRHLSGRVHEVGVHFNEFIDLGRFAQECVCTDTGIQSSAQLPQLSGKTLYIEDSVNDQELVKFHLGNLGVEVTCIGNGLEAIQMAASRPFNMVVTGVWLPGMSGPDIAASLREQGYKGPIIALTADDRMETRVEALERGCTAVLVKPYKFEHLVELLREHLETAAPPVT
jgi:CheY-like chemotaxis protein